jgi:hypothetical protein
VGKNLMMKEKKIKKKINEEKENRSQAVTVDPSA